MIKGRNPSNILRPLSSRWFLGMYVVLVFALVPPLLAFDLPDSFTAGSSASSTWVHRDSGFSFPASIAGFDRDRPVQYDDAGRDVSVGYHIHALRMIATFYVYPVEGQTLDEEFERRQQEVVTVHPKATLQSTGNADVSPRKVSARIATFLVPDMFKEIAEPMRSVLLVVQRDDHFIEYRISYPLSDGSAGDEAARRFYQEFPWP